MNGRIGLRLGVMAWAAILGPAEGREKLGEAGEIDAIPANLRRRLPAFARDALLCAMPLLLKAPDADLVFCSRNGDLASTVDLITDMAKSELLSPAKFSTSVHNAAAGLIGLALGRPGNHTAIAGDSFTLAAGLTDAYLRLAAGDAETVVLVFADNHLPAIYEGLDEAGPQTHLAMLLRLTDDADAGHALGPDRQGGADLARALAAGARTIIFAPPQLSAAAA